MPCNIREVKLLEKHMKSTVSSRDVIADCESNMQNNNFVDFKREPFRQLAMNSRGYKAAFLICLAAMQRGLQISFLYDSERVSAGANSDKDSVQVGRSFAISSNDRVVRFNNSLGPNTSKAASEITARKHIAKKYFAKAGVPTPLGDKLNKHEYRDFIKQLKAKQPNMKFVIKPFNGSLARDTYVNLTVDQLSDIVEEFPHDEFLIEEFISGPEYRFTVVNHECVGVFERLPASIVGNGSDTVEDLVKLENTKREQNPFLAGSLINLQKLVDVGEFPMSEIKKIPKLNESVLLTSLQRVGMGGSPRDLTDKMDSAFKTIAVDACRAVDAPNGGVDIIIPNLDDFESARVLEVNVRHHIEGHSFCENKEIWDNSVAEKIIDMYFPETENNEKNHKAVFDVEVVRNALQTQAFTAIHLPRVGQDWTVEHFVFDLSNKIHAALWDYVKPEIGSVGGNVTKLKFNKDLLYVVLCAPNSAYELFAERTKIHNSLSLAQEIKDIRKTTN